MVVRRLTRTAVAKLRYHRRRLVHPDRRGHEAKAAFVRYGRIAIPQLLDALTDESPVTRYNAVMAMGRIRARDCLDEIVALAESDPDDRVRYDAMVALGKLGDRRAIPSLRRWAEERVNEYGESGAAWAALSKLGEPTPSD